MSDRINAPFQALQWEVQRDESQTRRKLDFEEDFALHIEKKRQIEVQDEKRRSILEKLARKTGMALPSTGPSTSDSDDS